MDHSRNVRRGTRQAARVFGCLPLVLLCGCVQERLDGHTLTVSYQWWVPPAFIGPGVLLAAIAGGYCLKGGQKSRGLPLLALGVVFAVGAGPAVCLNRVIVSHEGFSVNRGLFWLFRENHEIQFAEVNRINFVEKEESEGRRRRRVKRTYMVVLMREPERREIALDRMLEAALPQIVSTAAEQGVQIFLQSKPIYLYQDIPGAGLGAGSDLGQ